MLTWCVWELCAVGLTHLPQGGQKMEVDGLSIAEDLQDTIQVYLVFTETPWRNQNSVYFLMFTRGISPVYNKKRGGATIIVT